MNADDIGYKADPYRLNGLERFFFFFFSMLFVIPQMLTGLMKYDQLGTYLYEQ